VGSRRGSVGRRGVARALLGLAWAAALGACGDDAASVTPGGTSSDGGDTAGTAPLGTGPADETTSSTAASGGDGTTLPGSTGDVDPGSTGSSGEPGGESSESGASSSESTGEPVLPPVVELEFTDVTLEAGLDYDHGDFYTAPDCVIDQIGPGTGGFCISERMTGAVAVSDYDGDGDFDLYATRIHAPDQLFRNEGDGTFVDVAAQAGVAFPGPSSGSLWADFDNDGDQDLYVTALGDTRYYLFVNDGSGTFTEQAIARGASLKSDFQHSPMGVAAGDYDNDGWLDLYVAEWKTDTGLGKQPSHSRLLHNLGEAAPGHFEDTTLAAGVDIDDVWSQVGAQNGTFGFAPAFADMDGDRFPDLLVVSDFGCSRLFWNDGDGTFTDGTLAAGVGLDKNGMGSTLGDYDLDGDLDWYVTSITSTTGEPDNRLYRYEGARQFTELSVPLGVAEGGWGWGTTFFDPDNDGDPDLFAGFGYYYTAYMNDWNRLWRNAGDGTFSPDVSQEAGVALPGGQTRGVVAFDYDGDGDEDLFVVHNLEHPALLRNEQGQLNHWLRVRTTGTTSNRDGIGAMVRVRASESGPEQTQQIGTASNYLGQAPHEAHFGLGFGDEPVAEVRVYWPATDVEQVFVDVPRGSILDVVEP
jgi:hypothetical protein